MSGYAEGVTSSPRSTAERHEERSARHADLDPACWSSAAAGRLSIAPRSGSLAVDTLIVDRGGIGDTGAGPSG